MKGRDRAFRPMPQTQRKQDPDQPSNRAGARAKKHDESAAQVLRQFRLIFSAVRNHFREVEKSAGIGGAQVWALSCIRDHPGVRVTELAAIMDVHPSTVSNLVRSLLASDLVRTEQGKEDRRAVLLHIRPAGRTVLRKVPGPFTGVLPQALRALDTATLRRLELDLAHVIDQLDTDADGARTPLAQL
jgi:DNA-binding MarR family transcriptional regulator